MQPRIWHQCRFADWVKLRNMMDSWDENLRKMRHCDWTIHRKLGEEAGLAHRYIIPARGSGKSMFIDAFDDPKKILRKNQNEPEPQEFVTIKDGDIEKWLQEELNRDVIEEICATIREFDRRAIMSKKITTVNPYWDYDSYVWVDSFGNLVYRAECSPGAYILDKEDLRENPFL